MNYMLWLCLGVLLTGIWREELKVIFEEAFSELREEYGDKLNDNAVKLTVGIVTVIVVHCWPLILAVIIMDSFNERD